MSRRILSAQGHSAGSPEGLRQLLTGAPVNWSGRLQRHLSPLQLPGQQVTAPLTLTPQLWCAGSPEEGLEQLLAGAPVNGAGRPQGHAPERTRWRAWSAEEREQAMREGKPFLSAYTAHAVLVDPAHGLYSCTSTSAQGPTLTLMILERGTAQALPQLETTTGVHCICACHTAAGRARARFCSFLWSVQATVQQCPRHSSQPQPPSAAQSQKAEDESKQSWRGKLSGLLICTASCIRSSASRTAALAVSLPATELAAACAAAEEQEAEDESKQSWGDKFSDFLTSTYGKLQSAAGEAVGVPQGEAWRRALQAAARCGASQVRPRR